MCDAHNLLPVSVFVCVCVYICRTSEPGKIVNVFICRA